MNILSGRALKSAVAVTLSVSLFFGSAGWPAARAFAAAIRAVPSGASSGPRALPGAGAAPLSAATLPASALHGAYSAAALSAAAPSAESARAAAAAGAASSASDEIEIKGPGQDGGPRWVDSRASERGWRGVTRDVAAWVGRSLHLWGGDGDKDGARREQASRREFDGARPAAEPAAAASAPAPAPAAQGRLSASREIERVVQDLSIPTPEAARRVGELRKEQDMSLRSKLWIGVGAVSAVAVAAHFAGIIPVAVLGAGLVVSVLLHEWGHDLMLRFLGDKTSRHAHSHGLLSHIDPVRTVLLPALTLAASAPFGLPMLFGSGKPVDADLNNLRGIFGGPRSARNAAWVAAMGPAMNLLLAGAAFGLAMLAPAGGVLAVSLIALAKMNLFLMAFNLLPLPQLDGGKILASLLPERLFAKWVYNPKVEAGYQGMFRRFYEGPSYILSAIADKLGIKSYRAINRLANLVTFATLGVAYAGAFWIGGMSIPLLFLALPCTYDYWCIREKVRSEAAVNEVMDLFSQWSGVIAEIAEGMGMQSEVDKFETEHAMKNALETLVDELMADESFRKLNEQQRMEKFMQLYPDKAAEFLKKYVFKDEGDSLEKVKELLRDGRNGPFYERLRRWFADHDIFNRWDNPKYEGKLRDAVKEGGQPKLKERGGRGPGDQAFELPKEWLHRVEYAMGRYTASLLPVAEPVGLGDSLQTWKTKLHGRAIQGKITVQLTQGGSVQLARDMMRPFPGASARGTVGRIVIDIPFATVQEGVELARVLGKQSLVQRVEAPFEIVRRVRNPASEIVVRASGEPEFPADWRQKLRHRPELADGQVQAYLNSDEPEDVRALLQRASETGATTELSARNVVLRSDERELLVRFARELARSPNVHFVWASDAALIESAREEGAAAPQDVEQRAAESAVREEAPAAAVDPSVLMVRYEGDASSFLYGILGAAGIAYVIEHLAPGSAKVIVRADAERSVEQAAELARRALTAAEGVISVRAAQAAPAAEPAAASEPAAERTEPAAERTEPAEETPAPAAPSEEELAARRARAEAEAAARRAQEEAERVEAAVQAPETGDWKAKIAGGVTELRELELELRASDAATVERFESLLRDLDAVSTLTPRGAGRFKATLRAFPANSAREAVEALAKLAVVARIALRDQERDELVAVPLPGKIFNHGKEGWSTTAVLVTFAANVMSADAADILKRQATQKLYRQGEAYLLRMSSVEAAARAARELAELDSVAKLELHPNAASILENKVVKPYPEAESYEPNQAMLVQFKEGVSEDAIKEYAELRRLRLVYPKFRGKSGMALFEVLYSGDSRATRQMLLDESLEEGSPVAEIKPFVEQPGEPALEPSAAARAAAAKRKAEAEAAARAAQRKPRRDAQQEWIAYVQSAQLPDGTLLNDAQKKTLMTFLKPIAKDPKDQRPPVVSRSEELKRTIPIVTSPRGMRNSVILTGPAGVGKTAVAEGLAEMIEEAEHATANDSEAFLQFKRLQGRWLVELDINKVLAAEEPVKVLSMILDTLPRLNLPDASRGNEIIVLMDEIQKFFLDPNGTKIANVLKGPLRDGKIAVIGTTTDKEYKDFIEKDDAFRRRFERIQISEPTVSQTARILRAMKAWLQRLHAAIIPDAGLEAAAKLTDRFDKTNFNPDKSIKAVQDAAELARPDNMRAAITLDIRETWNELVVAVNEARQTLLDKGLPSTLALPIEAYNRVAELIKKAEALYAERESVKDGEGVVTVEAIKRVIAQKTGIASGQLNMDEDDASRYNAMEDEIAKSVINQLPAITAIANAIRRNKAGLSNPSRPMGKFLLTGPTGVGKTYLAKMLAKFLFNDSNAMIRIDMSEYQEEHNAERFTGSPPGYVGHGAGGQLTEAVRAKPYSVILFDEIEKAHPKVFDKLLQILDDGRLTDGEGKTADFRNTVILLTSNAGMGSVDSEKYARLIEAVEKHNAAVKGDAEQLARNAARIAEIEKEWDGAIDAAVKEHVMARFRPEFLNRLDEDPNSKNKWIRVNRLRRQDVGAIAKLQVKELQQLLADVHDTDIVVDPKVYEFLSVEGFSHLYGARPMTSAVEKHIIDPMAKWILEEAAQGRKNVRGGLIKIGYDGTRITFDAQRKPEKVVARVDVKGASELMAAEVFSLLERLSAGQAAEEPSEGAFDRMLRAALPRKEGKPEAEARPAEFYGPGEPLSMPASAKAFKASHNKAKSADVPLRNEIKAVAEAAKAAGWGEDVLNALSVPPSAQGEGWLKQLAAWAKERAAAVEGAAPIELVSAVSGDAVRVLVHFDAELSEKDQALLAAHFTGTPPPSYEAAQRLVDNLNLNGGMIRNNHLLDLYRRLKAIPGARMGWAGGAAARGGKGTDLWLEIVKPAAKAGAKAAAPETAAPAPASAAPFVSAQQPAPEVQKIMMHFIDQSRLPEGQRDGPSIRIAAAEGWARLSTPADLAVVRKWIADGKWADEDVAGRELIEREFLVMTAAHTLAKHGGLEDIETLEKLSAKIDDYGHFRIPLHNALTSALASLYAKAGLAETRKAARRAAQLGMPGGSRHNNDKDIKPALASALGRLGYPADEDDVKGSARGLAKLYERMGKADELRAEFYDDKKWRSASEARKRAILVLVGRTPAPTGETFKRLGNLLNSSHSAYDSDSRHLGFGAADAWANLIGRTGRSKGLGAAIARIVPKGLSSGSMLWTVIYAHVLAAERAGGEDSLPGLEALMRISPSSLASQNEQAYFHLPEAWAAAAIRSGKFREYSQGALKDGKVQPSKLQQMLTSKEHPMLVAAALRAMALAKDAGYAPGRPGAEPLPEMKAAGSTAALAYPPFLSDEIDYSDGGMAYLGG